MTRSLPFLPSPYLGRPTPAQAGAVPSHRVSTQRHAGSLVSLTGLHRALDVALCAGNSIAAGAVAQINFPRLGVNQMGMNTAHTALAIDRVADLQAMLWSLVHQDGRVSPQEARVLATANELSLTLEQADWDRRAAASYGSIGRLSDYLHKQSAELDRRWAELTAPQRTAA